ncbi:hypothetical protein CBR_g19276 [Chara braunii]|uniref:Uncharacterized protein n=1 Tax=Chara braunii TaxID=69332 RepID=A0A388KXH9_CHABU|nr:hypothetical protein CBR_g19276 [Chara braunii]|eukprot:GBG74764.1 hypothetical protein CBR_g19276 [Chara braunii]
MLQRSGLAVFASTSDANRSGSATTTTSTSFLPVSEPRPFTDSWTVVDDMLSRSSTQMEEEIVLPAS